MTDKLLSIKTMVKNAKVEFLVAYEACVVNKYGKFEHGEDVRIE